MAKQRFLNNFTSTFIAAVKDAPSSGTPETELDYGVLRISDGAAGSLINPTDGDYYLLTAFKRSGSVESNIEVMRVTGVNNAIPGECRITVQRAQEGTSAKAFVAGDYLSLRITKGTAENFSQPADLATKEPVIAAPGSAPTEKYWRGDKTWRDFFTDVRAATLTGLSTAANTVVAATDTVLAAIGKLQAQLNLKAPLASPSFTGTPTGITKEHVGLGNADNTSDASKPISTATQTALDGKANSNTPTFSGRVAITTGTVSQSIPEAVGAVDTLEVTAPSNTGAAFMSFHRPGAFAAHFGIDTDNKLKIGGWSWGATSHAIYHEGYKPTKTDVGLGNVDNTSDANKPVSTAQAAAIAARYGKDNILGTVSQSAGVPTGALIERGSNANGEYVRFADGTQICTISSSFTSNADVVWTYPAVFAADPNYLSASVNHPSDPRYYDVDTAITSGNVSATIYRSLQGTSRTPVADPFAVCAMAIGRWF